MQKISNTIKRIAIKSNAPGADSANNPVEKVNTQNISGPSITIFCSRFSGLHHHSPFHRQELQSQQSDNKEIYVVEYNHLNLIFEQTILSIEALFSLHKIF